MLYSLFIEPEAHQDIQKGIDWYNEKREGLGREFYDTVELYFQSLKTNPFYQIRYKNIRCFPLKEFPYMIHFTVDEPKNCIIIRAVFNTSKDPQNWR